MLDRLRNNCRRCGCAIADMDADGSSIIMCDDCTDEYERWHVWMERQEAATDHALHMRLEEDED